MGAACQTSSGARAIATSMLVWTNLLRTNAMTAIAISQCVTRPMRNLVQSVSLRWVTRSNPPKIT
jgi:hypothetical protein